VGHDDRSEVLKSPGQLTKHYVPKAKLMILKWENETDLKAQLAAVKSAGAHRHVIAHTHIPSQAGFSSVSVIPHDAEAFARALYAELHRCDERGAELIIVEAPPETSEWRAIVDRLKRASSG
jgi:L-threonylcarbamoyladenylate synthase